ncbi:DNA polymerase III subunit beta [Lentzea aerocolonigenes]|uniref:DNA polymerase III subunit beta n=1 Tax=Lentzea aerocolonigenes TaxID=68170 RepID=A0A0F0H580_LENAE|nr:DNA polymerase III subunit beta [Lentzea aerocolonigenes]KJK50011.1 DNA polymerase III subunit beta [Lentzea aerocolonigenes]
MDLTVTTAELAGAAAEVARLLPARVLDPVLAGLRIKAGTHVEVAGSDQEHGVRLTVNATVHTEGEVLVPAKPLAATLQALDDPQVRLKVEGQRLAIRTPTSRFALPLLDLNDHPGIPNLPPRQGTVDAGHLKTIAAVAGAASKDDALPIFTGIRIQSDARKLHVMATDRYRMAYATLPWEQEGQLDLLVPAKPLVEAARQATGRVALHANADRIGLTWDHNEISTALLAAPFPDDRARRLLEAVIDSTVLVDADALARAVRRATPYGGPHQAVTIQVEDSELRVKGSDPQQGESEEFVKATVEGDRLTKTFQARYLADALKAFAGRRIELKIQDGLRSTVLTSTPGEDGVELTYLVVPMRSVA